MQTRGARSFLNLKNLFDCYQHHNTFRALVDLALDDVRADDLITAFELKQIWLYQPKFWSIRRKGSHAPIIPHGGERLLGWTKAARFADLSMGLPAEQIIDDDWYDDWLQLPFGDPLSWSFIEYASARLESFSAGVLQLPRALWRVNERQIGETKLMQDLSIDGFRLGGSARTGMLVRMETDAWILRRSGDGPSPTCTATTAFPISRHNAARASSQLRRCTSLKGRSAQCGDVEWPRAETRA